MRFTALTTLLIPAKPMFVLLPQPQNLRPSSSVISTHARASVPVPRPIACSWNAEIEKCGTLAFCKAETNASSGPFPLEPIAIISPK